MKDKTYYIEHNGEMMRVRASKKPSKKTIEALKAMADAASKQQWGSK